METVKVLYILYLIAFNTASFIMMGIDKNAAIKGNYRIPERTLMALAAFGGSLGAITGMLVFRHKTKHKKFVIGVPLLMVFNAAIAYVVFALA
ncbi:MAG: DUF1294 domain-containing protein [Candidatus Gastranaerophilaceae bacterium]|jgi:uncharacterized membrane protein YsdA (DUF1294 family)|nr:DUF1294 domain-containing protein [Christensenellales bacterium]